MSDNKETNGYIEGAESGASLISGANEKAVRLMGYLREVASLRLKLIRKVTSYENVLWISDIPKQNECFTRAWGQYESHENSDDIWVKIKNKPQPRVPDIPAQCKDWVHEPSLLNKEDTPSLFPDITREIENPDWQEGSEEPDTITQEIHLEDYPEVQSAWDHYINNSWLPWVEKHNEWKKFYDVYSHLFEIRQKQLALGEEYELILGLGLLTWQSPSGSVQRHLIVANASLEFESQLGQFTIRAGSNGANLRAEFDMIDLVDQPERAEEIAESALESAKDDPWEGSCVEGAIKAIVHSIRPDGEYRGEDIEGRKTKESTKPVVEYAPAIILRKRSTAGLVNVLKEILKKIEGSGEVPDGIRDLAEIELESGTDSDGDSKGEEDAVGEADDEIFFPLPSNEEQRCIIEKLRVANRVLVQGPPGTGKSHTIANLISHLLAKGQRVLITAKMPRALQVLEKLMPDDLRPLCINLLGSGIDERESLESSVRGILQEDDLWNENKAEKERKEWEKRLGDLREEKSKIQNRLRSIRESETYDQSIIDGAYQGTASQIAKQIENNKDDHEWFEDVVFLDKPFPVSKNDLRSSLDMLRWITPEKRQELNLAYPTDIPSGEDFSNLVKSEKEAIAEENRWSKKADESDTEYLRRIDINVVEKIQGSLVDFQNKNRHLSALPYPWVHEALENVKSGASLSLWREHRQRIEKTINYIGNLVSIADRTVIEPRPINARILLDDVCKLKMHVESGGKLGWGPRWAPFRPQVVKEQIHVVTDIRVNGKRCSNLDQMKILVDTLSVRVKCEEELEIWDDQPQKSYSLQLLNFKERRDVLDDVLSLSKATQDCRENMHGGVSSLFNEPVWSDESEVKKLIASCESVLARQKKNIAFTRILEIETPLKKLASKNLIHPCVNQLIKAIEHRDADGYVIAEGSVKNLAKESQRFQKASKHLSKIRRAVPEMMNQLENSCNENFWEKRIENIDETWRWAQAKFWIEDYIQKKNTANLERRMKEIEDEIGSAISKLASLYAWSFCFSRLEDNHRRSMVAWQQAIKKVGKGTGKSAPRWRRAAQKHLAECHEAVPAWVMPLYRVWDTVDPVPGMFDVVIVDEASQCGVEAFPLFYLGKKILVVGDDEQISPEAVGVPDNAMNALMSKYLPDFQFKDSFDVKSSLFDHGRLRFGKQKITLREHFRCMPEIILFSNNLCYYDTRLIPLRQYGSDRLTPPIAHIFVDGGYREGSGSSVRNGPEARAIVEKIIELCEDSRYDGKTMGVITLQGKYQAHLIEGELLEKLGVKEMEERRIICGDSYSFQGDERDVIFLSMVAAVTDDINPHPLTKDTDKRRFNVAASRARDQMFLFHSVSRNDLRQNDYRRKLLEFFEDSKPQEVAGVNLEELEARALRDNRLDTKPPGTFESWFEVDVALEVLGKKYTVQSQCKFAGKRIDLVVEGGQARLAIECDGDDHHGLDRYDEDMDRQRQLERCGWEFFRVRASAFYANRKTSLEKLWEMLAARGIFPTS